MIVLQQKNLLVTDQSFLAQWKTISNVRRSSSNSGSFISVASFNLLSSAASIYGDISLWAVITRIHMSKVPSFWGLRKYFLFEKNNVISRITRFYPLLCSLYIFLWAVITRIHI